MTRYAVTAERSGKWWVLQAVDVPGAISQVARLDQADEIKEAIAFVAGVPESEVDYQLRPVLPTEWTERMQQAEKLREESMLANARSAEVSREAARAMKANGLTLRDIGTLMGVSFQRASQLVGAPASKARAEDSVRSPKSGTHVQSTTYSSGKRKTSNASKTLSTSKVKRISVD